MIRRNAADKGGCGMHLLAHLQTIHRHRVLVRKSCFRIGLYWQGLTHDLSKYSPAEFLPGIKYYQGTRSPNDAQRTAEGYSSSWLHHKGRNRHHFEYWTDYSSVPGQGVVGVEMPLKYVAEMFCDRLAACKVYHPNDFDLSDPYHYFQRSRHLAQFHVNTANLLESWLLILKDEGEDAAYAHIRRQLQEARTTGKESYDH